MTVHLLIIDPQNDFCVAEEKQGHRGALAVPGAFDDMVRLAAMIDRVSHQISTIHVSLDSHHSIGIERPIWWKRVSDGLPPDPFTVLGIHPDANRIVRIEKIEGHPTPTEEEYTTYLPDFLYRGGPTGTGSFGYLQALVASGRYLHTVWPVHCVIGTWGWCIVPELAEALHRWEVSHFTRVNYVMKGTNPWTEQFSCMRAEVPDPNDVCTQVNDQWIRLLEKGESIAVAGEALSHCVAYTLKDMADLFTSSENVQRIVLLTDATSCVPGYDSFGAALLEDMTHRGMKTSTTTHFLI